MSAPSRHFKPVVIPLLAWFICSCFVFYEILLRIFPNIITSPLTTHFHLTHSQLGLISGCYFFSYGFMQIPSGMILDKIRLVIVMPVGALLCSVGVWLFSHTDSFFLACMARILMGTDASVAFIGTIKVIIHYYPKQLAFVSGCSMTIGAFAGIVCNSFLLRLNDNAGWHAVTSVIFVSGALLTVALVICCLGIKLTKTSATKKTLSFSFLVIPRLWQISLICSLCYLPYAVLNDLWGVPFLMQADGLNHTQAGTVISSIWLGWIIGSPLVGLISDKLGSYTKLIFTLGLAQGVVLAILFFSRSLPFAALELLGAIIGICASSMTLCYLWVSKVIPTHVGVSVAIVNTVVTLVVSLTLPMIGLLLDHSFFTGSAKFRACFGLLIITTMVYIVLVKSYDDPPLNTK